MFIRYIILFLFSITSLIANSREKLKVFIPEKPTGTAVIVCPGGSYFWHDFASEGDSVASALSDSGITAFVLDYSVASAFDFLTHSRLIFRGHRYPDMLTDIQDAIVKIRRGEYGISPERIGVIGFSAGGHLALLSAESYRDSFTTSVSSATERRPDFVASIYPVVSMSSPYTHKRSRRGALGDSKSHNRIMRDSLSMELHADRIDCPVFLLNCDDDDVVDYHNSLLMDSALTASHVPHKYIKYQVGGHGFGYNHKHFTEETSHWMRDFLNWVKDLSKGKKE